MANRITIDGYVSGEVRKSYTPKGKVIHWITVAAYEQPKPDGTKVVNYLSVKFWDSFIGEKLVSGSHVLVWGYVSSWPVKNNDGQIVRTDQAIEAIRISVVVEKPKEEHGSPPAGTTSTPPPQGNDDPPPDFNDEDIPFS